MVYIILGKGFEPVEAIAPCDILRRGGVDVKLAGIGGKTVEAAHGVTVAADCTVEEIDQKADSAAWRAFWAARRRWTR